MSEEKFIVDKLNPLMSKILDGSDLKNLQKNIVDLKDKLEYYIEHLESLKSWEEK